MATRVLAVLSAVLLVGAIAIATLGPQDTSLGGVLAAFDHARFSMAEGYIRSHLSGWLWEHPIQALLVRPPWLPPAVLGVILAGAAITSINSHKAANSRRRRS